MTNSRIFTTILVLFSLLNISAKEKPNLLLIHTDEHNLRTLGCYRATMSDEQAYMWGKNTVVKTPNLDRIADQGVLCKNWYASSPVCTPSRASIISGLYPIATGSPVNDMPLNDDVITFAHILKEQGYATSYVGKWHLDGDAKPGFAPARQFGFDDNRYMFNRGHWKILGENENGPFVDQGLTKYGGGEYEPERVNEENFTTDFLFKRAIEIIDRDKKEKPFCMMLSIPDPHGPNQVRPPYDTMYSGMHFEDPRTMHPDPEATPKWNNLQGNKNKAKTLKQEQMAQYYGMVKCIDDNVGKLLAYLDKEKILDNTIIVFTSDHGDLMGEHGKHNKGLPYEMSARVAFMIQYPKGLPAGKQIERAYTMADFTPTILGLMDVDHSAYAFHGIDASADFTSKEDVVDDRIVYITNAYGRWVAAVDNRYKLVLSPSDSPWLFDLKNDPDEIINYYNHPDYKAIAKRMEKELYKQMKQFGEPLLSDGKI